MFQNILACVDGSDPAHKAVEVAGDLAERYEAALTLLCVWSEATDLLQAAANEIVDREAQSFAQRKIARLSKTVEFGAAARVVADRVASDNFDLVVIGSRGRGRVRGLLLGSVSQSVASECPCTCLIVK